ncbi:Phage regulatory protein Rha [Photorhabdus australis subsp. thailandensis]|uniref:Phage regulatory protein Rha n=1 Tax=Photorhabdus australis subsp. thailandensis TaxID=2805096 RepID=A0A1C0U6P0_9GAMM|nr:Rha family transcriptional regulator [Photorhabdus australis]OCQ53555.1 Phage regulatory protein Rha [Photorhabdus australis subsp. thailandensis]
MNNVTLAANSVTMSSREIAKLTGKNHADLCRDIRVMLSALYSGEEKDYIRNADLLYFTNQCVGCVQYDITNPNAWEYHLDRRHTEILITGYDVKRRAAVIDRLVLLESNTRKSVKSQSGLPEYRRARTLKMSVDAVSNLFNLMPHLSNESKQCAAANIINPIVGFEAVPLPVLEEKYYTAGEVGKMLDLSANKIGRIANEHNLKTEQYGKFFLDKSAHSNKQVEAFRYNENGIKALRHLIHGVEVA